jgi:hypothetical protein
MLHIASGAADASKGTRLPRRTLAIRAATRIVECRIEACAEKYQCTRKPLHGNTPPIANPATSGLMITEMVSTFAFKRCL